MNLNEAIRILQERAEINRAMCPVAHSDFDRFCRDEADAIDLVVKELKNGRKSKIFKELLEKYEEISLQLIRREKWDAKSRKEIEDEISKYKARWIWAGEDE